MFKEFFLPVTYLFSTEKFSDFFASPIGICSTLIFVFILMLLFSKLLKQQKVLSTRTITYSSICIALATILSLYTFFKMPQGGSVSFCSMLFICLVGYWFGPSAGFIAGFVHGLLQLLFGAYIVYPIQLLLDYPIAFGVLGFSGFFRNKKNGLLKGYIFGCMCRFLVSSLSGFIFFSDVTKSTVVSIIASLTYNISYILPEVIITLVIISIPSFSKALNLLKENK